MGPGTPEAPNVARFGSSASRPPHRNAAGQGVAASDQRAGTALPEYCAALRRSATAIMASAVTVMIAIDRFLRSTRHLRRHLIPGSRDRFATGRARMLSGCEHFYFSKACAGFAAYFVHPYKTTTWMNKYKSTLHLSNLCPNRNLIRQRRDPLLTSSKRHWRTSPC